MNKMLCKRKIYLIFNKLTTVKPTVKIVKGIHNVI